LGHITSAILVATHPKSESMNSGQVGGKQRLESVDFAALSANDDIVLRTNLI